MAIIPDFHPASAAYVVPSRKAPLPSCDALRACLGTVILVQHVIPERLRGLDGLGLIEPLGFALSGLLIAGLMLRDRSSSPPGQDVDESWPSAFLRIFPLQYVTLAIAAIFFLPGLEALVTWRSTPFDDFPAWLDRKLVGCMAWFDRHSLDEWSWTAWPLLMVLTPRRGLLPILLVALGLGLTSRFSTLFGLDLRLVAILVPPTACDLLAVGAILATACYPGRDANQGRLGLWSILTGISLTGATLGFVGRNGMPSWSKWPLLGHPGGFGLANLTVLIAGLILVASLVCRSLGGSLVMTERPRRR